MLEKLQPPKKLVLGRHFSVEAEANAVEVRQSRRLDASQVREVFPSMAPEMTPEQWFERARVSPKQAAGRERRFV
jgi:hypothetical protein